MVDPGELIRSARTRAGLTQQALADRLGCTQSAIAKLEGRSSNPRLATVRRALHATGYRLELSVAARSPGVDESLVRRHLELPIAERIRGIESMYDEARRIALAGARGRGELA